MTLKIPNVSLQLEGKRNDQEMTKCRRRADKKPTKGRGEQTEG